jgi:voltage-gated potassium channel
MGKIKRRFYEILEVASPGDKPSRIFDIFIISLIFLNVVAIILETIEKLSLQFSAFFRIFEIFSVIIFTIEYVSRVWSSTENPKHKKPIAGRVRFILTPLALVDLFAILPFYLPMFIPFDLRFLRAIRLIRIFRLFKMGRYSESMKLFGKVFKAKKEELFIAVFAVFILLTISSSLLYYVEHDAQPQAFSSIPSAMWWGVATLATVGYGDVYPITPLGKFFGAIISLLGIGMFALPAGILSAGFVEEIRKRRESVKTCCFVSSEFGPLMIFLKRWFAYNKTTQGDMHEYQEKVIA